MNQFDRQYRHLIKKIMQHGETVFNERTGHETKALPGLTFELNTGQDFPILSLRKIPIKLFVSEMIWYITGTNRPDDFLNDFTGIWKNFTEQDGTVAACYGYRWRKHFQRDQLGDLIKHLQDNPGSRHGVIITWDPSDDGLGTGTPKKNIPCPYTFTVNIINGKLNLHNIIRSNDMMLGCPHDMAGFALLQCLLAAKLGVKVGKLTTSISHAHIYDIHYSQALEIMQRNSNQTPIIFTAQANSFKRAEKGEKKLVTEIVNNLNPQYSPLPPIKGLKIVL